MLELTYGILFIWPKWPKPLHQLLLYSHKTFNYVIPNQFGCLKNMLKSLKDDTNFKH